MKTITGVLVLLSVVAATAVPHSQAQTKVGIGVSLTGSGASIDFFEALLSPATIYVPITFGSFRIEPEFGIFRTSSSSGDSDFSSSETVLQLGTGLFGLKRVNQTQIYYGIRVGMTRVSSSSKFSGTKNDDSRTNIYFSPATGAEYLFSDHFSLGGEMQLVYLSLGSSDGSDASGSIIRTRGLFFSRWHF